MKSSAVKKHKAFQKKVKQTLADSFLKQTLGRFADDYLVSRQKVMTDNYFQSRQEAIKTIKSQSVARLDELINQRTVSGNRYNEQSNREVDTEIY